MSKVYLPTGVPLTGRRIMWGSTSVDGMIKFDGTPHIVVAEMRMNCVHGTDKHACDKKKLLNKKIAEQVSYAVKCFNLKMY